MAHGHSRNYTTLTDATIFDPRNEGLIGIVRGQPKILVKRMIIVRIEPSMTGVAEGDQILQRGETAHCPWPDVMNIEHNIGIVIRIPAANPASPPIPSQNLHPKLGSWSFLKGGIIHQCLRHKPCLAKLAGRIGLQHIRYNAFGD